MDNPIILSNNKDKDKDKDKERDNDSDSDSGKNNKNKRPSSKRTEMCEFCGLFFAPDQTTLKLCNGRVRSVCFACMQDITDQDKGVDLTKPK
jgi:hypothetical protein